MKINPGFSFSQTGSEGVRPEEKTQGRETADPTAAYSLVPSVDGWMIPVRVKKGEVRRNI